MPRGLACKEVVYSEDRLRQPLKRVGKRGSGDFEPVSSEDALNTVAKEIWRVRDLYGPTAVFLMDHYGSLSPLHGVQKAGRRFFSLFGGCTTWRGNFSREAATCSSLATLGAIPTGCSPDNFPHSRLIILWGWNPAVTRFGPDTAYHLPRAKQAGAKIICVDPRHTASAEALAGQWIPIRPGTDAALLIAMAYVIIREDLWDRSFIKTCTVAFER